MQISGFGGELCANKIASEAKTLINASNYVTPMKRTAHLLTFGMALWCKLKFIVNQPYRYIKSTLGW